jgi:putative ABC transport system permease protein
VLFNPAGVKNPRRIAELQVKSDKLGIRGTFVSLTVLVAILAGILFGIAPAWQLSRLGRFDALKEGGRSATAGLSRQRMRAGLVIGEVALARVLLVGAGFRM